MRIALISDTHLPGEVRHLGQLGVEIEAFLSTVDLILHGGDTVSESVFDWLEQFAPVIAAEGNNDHFKDRRMKPVQFLDVDGWRIGMRHDVPEEEPVDDLRRRYFNGEHVDIIVHGHTHYETLTYREGTILINSGSPILPHQYSARLGTAGLLEITPAMVHAEIVVLGHTEGRRNPGETAALRLEDGIATEPQPATG